MRYYSQSGCEYDLIARNVRLRRQVGLSVEARYNLGRSLQYMALDF